jgi:hypothetical protein
LPTSRYPSRPSSTAAATASAMCQHRPLLDDSITHHLDSAPLAFLRVRNAPFHARGSRGAFHATTCASVITSISERSRARESARVGRALDRRGRVQLLTESGGRQARAPTANRGDRVVLPLVRERSAGPVDPTPAATGRRST